MKAQRKNDNGLNKRQQARNDNIAKIAEMMSKGLKQIEMAEVLGVTKGMISQYVKIIKECKDNDKSKPA